MGNNLPNRKNVARERDRDNLKFCLCVTISAWILLQYSLSLSLSVCRQAAIYLTTNIFLATVLKMTSCLARSIHPVIQSSNQPSSNAAISAPNAYPYPHPHPHPHPDPFPPAAPAVNCSSGKHQIDYVAITSGSCRCQMHNIRCLPLALSSSLSFLSLRVPCALTRLHLNLFA